MYKKFSITIILFLALLAACGNSNSSSVENKSIADEGLASSSLAVQENAAGTNFNNSESNRDSSTNNTTITTTTRMIAFEAEMSIAVKGLDDKVTILHEEIKKLGGYLVESSIYEIGEGRKNSRIVARVPQDQFEQFLAFVESQSEQVFERNVHGQDVTEEYVDLESRLRAKKAVEDRLLSFMKNAEKTEDLLKISKDLDQIQEEIEQIEGKMKFLENRTSYSAITLHIQDSEIIVPEINTKDLNTWQQSKKTFVETIHGLKGILSGLIIFVIGFSPVWLFMAAIGIILWTYLRKRKSKQKNDF